MSTTMDKKLLYAIVRTDYVDNKVSTSSIVQYTDSRKGMNRYIEEYLRNIEPHKQEGTLEKDKVDNLYILKNVKLDNIESDPEYHDRYYLIINEEEVIYLKKTTEKSEGMLSYVYTSTVSKLDILNKWSMIIVNRDLLNTSDKFTFGDSMKIKKTKNNSININKFNLSNINLSSTINIIGKNGTGKRLIAKKIIINKNIPDNNIIIISEDKDNFYENNFPKATVTNDLTAAKQILSQNIYKTIIIDATYLSKDEINSEIFEDVLYDKTKLCIVIMQQSKITNEDCRRIFDYVFMTFEDFYTNQTRMHSHYADFFKNFHEFSNILTNVTKDNNSLVIKGKRSTRLTDNIMYYKY